MRATRFYLYNNPLFIDLRRATIESTKDLYGACSNEVIQVASAWRAVGLDEFMNFQPTFEICGNIGGFANNQIKIYYALNSVNLPASNCNPQSINIINGSTLTMTSGVAINLRAGFKAEYGSQFRASISPCVNQLLRRGILVDKPQSNLHDSHVDLFSNDGWNIYPNPSTGILNIFHSSYSDLGKFKIEILNYRGQKIEDTLETRNIANNVITIRTIDLLPGLYFLKLKDEDNNYKVLKFTIQN